MADLNKLMDDMQAKIQNYALTNLPANVKEATTDGAVFLKETKDKLADWAASAEKGEMTADDVKWLIQSQNALKDLNALKQTGLAKIKVDAFQNQLLTIVVNGISSLIPK